MAECKIGEFSDYFSHWYGLEDGTLLSINNRRGRFWIKVGNDRVMTVEEFNEQQNEE